MVMPETLFGYPHRFVQESGAERLQLLASRYDVNLAHQLPPIDFNEYQKVMRTICYDLRASEGIRFEHYSEAHWRDLYFGHVMFESLFQWMKHATSYTGLMNNPVRHPHHGSVIVHPIPEDKPYVVFQHLPEQHEENRVVDYVINYVPGNVVGSPCAIYLPTRTVFVNNIRRAMSIASLTDIIPISQCLSVGYDQRQSTRQHGDPLWGFGTQTLHPDTA